MGDRNLHILPLGTREEKLLLARLRQGDDEAFELLYHHFVGRVMGLANQLLRDRTLAEDAAQETFIRVYRNIHRFRADSSLATWIHRITTNVCLTELDRRQRRSARERGASTEEPAAHSEPTQGPRNEIGVSLSQLLGRLEPLKRLTFYLCHVEGLSAAEIAQVTKEKRATVHKRLQRTRRELMTMWRGLGEAARDRDQCRRGNP